MLDGLVVRTSDVSSVGVVVTIPGGRDVSGETTLDLCNGTFPSEAKRTARRQVEVVDVTLAAPFSTEAVLYGHPADASQAFSELRRVASQCPASPVVSPVGEPTVTTRFSAPPDRAWGTTTSVERQAYAFTTTDDSGDTNPGVSVYLRRGRVLMGLYFSQPDGEQIAIDGNTTIPGDRPRVRTPHRRTAGRASSTVRSAATDSGRDDAPCGERFRGGNRQSAAPMNLHCTAVWGRDRASVTAEIDSTDDTTDVGSGRVADSAECNSRNAPRWRPTRNPPTSGSANSGAASR